MKMTGKIFTATAFCILFFSIPGLSRVYTTSFPLTENPISENGNWISGAAVGLDWGDVSTTPGQTHPHPGPARYADATALLTGTWGPDQTVQGTVFVNTAFNYPEVELRLRSTLSPHVCNGYEVSFSLPPNGYLLIVRWNGPLGDWSVLQWPTGSQYAVNAGDVVKATIVGNVITAYKNGVQMAQATDNTFTTGNPGMGFNEQQNGDQGYSSFSATDGTTSINNEIPTAQAREQSSRRTRCILQPRGSGVCIQIRDTKAKSGESSAKIFDLSGHEITGKVQVQARF
jgi:hypothetical protein